MFAELHTTRIKAASGQKKNRWQERGMGTNIISIYID
jgi:hypothetical protein